MTTNSSNKLKSQIIKLETANSNQRSSTEIRGNGISPQILSEHGDSKMQTKSLKTCFHSVTLPVTTAAMSSSHQTELD